MCMCFCVWECVCRHQAMAECTRVASCGGVRPTYRDVAPELCHVVVVAAEELGEPADGPLAALVHRFVALKVLIVFVDRVVGQVHVELALWGQREQERERARLCFLMVYSKVTLNKGHQSSPPVCRRCQFHSQVFHEKYAKIRSQTT